MKNTISKTKFTFLVIQRRDFFVGICRETGYIEFGDSEMDVVHRLVNGAIAIYTTVSQNPRLIKSLNQRPPMRYLALFYVLPFVDPFVRLLKPIQEFIKYKKANLFDITPLEILALN